VSLDVYLKGPIVTVECECTECDNVHTRQRSPTLFDWNITHNLTKMADAAGLHEVLWRPEEIGVLMACHMIDRLRAGLELLRSDPDRFKALNPDNGWGDYNGLVKMAAAYLAACEEHPTAAVRVSR